MKITTHHSLVFSIFSNILYYVIAFPILKLLLKIVYDLKIEGKENIRNIKEWTVERRICQSNTNESCSS